jgi:uncharacterized protein DUF3298
MPAKPKLRMAGMLFVSGLFLTAIACAGLFGVVPSGAPATLAPTATAVPTETALPLYQQVALSGVPWQEQVQPVGYTISAEIPVLVGSDDPRVQTFNAEMKAIVEASVAGFKNNLANIPPSPSSTESTFQLRYNLLSPPGNILSLKFDIQTFYTGAAHPGDSSQTITFDLERGQDVSLADLFVPDVDYLTALSKYCIAQLNTRDIGFQGFELGATATAQNYRNWNITADGLMITFDEYQVAPYAAGPQTVVIPYKALARTIERDGPLAAFVH